MQAYARFSSSLCILASLFACQSNHPPTAPDSEQALRVESSAQLDTGVSRLIVDQQGAPHTEDSDTPREPGFYAGPNVTLKPADRSGQSDASSPSGRTESTTTVSGETKPSGSTQPSSPAPQAQPSPSSENDGQHSTFSPEPEGPEVRAANSKIALNFQAHWVNPDRELIPITQTEFIVRPYNLPALQAAAARRNQVEARPLAPSSDEPRFRIEKKLCSSSGCTSEQGFDSEAYQQALHDYQQSVLPEWESRAYVGLVTDIELAAQGREVQRFRTNDRGEAVLQLESGMWYFSGRHHNAARNVVWEAASFEIKSNTHAVHLTG